MNHLNVAYNCELLHSGFLPEVGDFCLKPMRYFFCGRTVEVLRVCEVTEDEDPSVESVPSYVEKFDDFALSEGELKPSTKSYWKTMIMVAFFIPGVIFGLILKSLAYCFTEKLPRCHSPIITHLKESKNIYSHIIHYNIKE